MRTLVIVVLLAAFFFTARGVALHYSRSGPDERGDPYFLYNVYPDGSVAWSVIIPTRAPTWKAMSAHVAHRQAVDPSSNMTEEVMTMVAAGFGERRISVGRCWVIGKGARTARGSMRWNGQCLKGGALQYAAAADTSI